MTVTFRAVGSWENGATGLTADEVVSIPVGSTTGDMMLLLASWKDFAITAQVSGWTELLEVADGTVATGNGLGSMKVGCWYKEHTGSESDPTLDFSTATGLLGEATIISFQRSLGAWSTPVAVAAPWPLQTGPALVSLGGGTLTIPSGGAVLALMGVRDDGSFSSVSITENSGSAITWTAVTAHQPATDASTTTGNDMSCGAWYRLVTTGSTNKTIDLTTTLAASETGEIMVVVLGDEAAAAPRTPFTNRYPQLLAH